MYAILETGGKQFRVGAGDVIDVELLKNADGETVMFDNVLAISRENGEMVFGAPFIDGAKVTGKVVKHGKARKILVFHYKQKVNERKRYGHRQPYTRVEIQTIEG